MSRTMRHIRRAQRGVTMLVVLVLLTVMLLGGVSLARLTEISTMAAGNASFRDLAMQASEVGLNNGFAQLKTLSDLNANQGGWYFATMQELESTDGLPKVNWEAVPSTQVGAYEVRTVVERMCSVAEVTDPLQQCLVRQVLLEGSNTAGLKKVDPPNATQYRVTVRVVGPKDTQAWVQSLMARGSVQ